MEFNKTAEYARALDRQDPLTGFRDRFFFSDPELIYMDGNSLGRMPQASFYRLAEVDAGRQWGGAADPLVDEGWSRPPRVGEKIAPADRRGSGQVIVSDSTSVNLYKLGMAALALRPERKDRHRFAQFPYRFICSTGLQPGAGRRVLQSKCCRPGRDASGMDLQTCSNAIDENTALVSLSHVHFKSGYLLRRGSDHPPLPPGGRAGAVGSQPPGRRGRRLLDDWDADFAVGCTYKYLNGGPGAPAFLYVKRRLQGQAHRPSGAGLATARLCLRSGLPPAGISSASWPARRRCSRCWRSSRAWTCCWKPAWSACGPSPSPDRLPDRSV